MDPYISKKVGVLRFVAVAWVVVFHAYPTPAAGSSAAADSFEAIVSLGLARWALPFLSLVSGYLFFRTFTPTVAGYATKLRGRARTILVPFLVWSGVAVLFAAVTGDPEFGGPIESPGEALYHWLLHPVATPLWFLQALMTCVVLSPLVYLAVRALRGWVLLVALAWWLTGVQADTLWPWVSPVAFPPFIVGAAIALLRPDLAWARRPAPLPLVFALFAAWLAAGALFGPHSLDLGPWTRLAMLPAVVLGCGAMWTGADALRGLVGGAPRLPAAALAAAPLAFFVYATQQPQLKAIMLMLGSRAAGLPQVVSYLIAPLLAIAFSLAAALVLRRAAPQAFTLASGGRAARDSPTTLAPELAKSGP